MSDYIEEIIKNETTLSNNSINFFITEKCPLCGGISHPKLISKTNYKPSKDINPVLTFQCGVCKKYYCYEYKILNADTYTLKNGYKSNNLIGSIIEYSKMPPVNFPYSDEIELLSKEFKKCYLESKVAEVQELNSIAGMGYRKAVEFLIKDYLINFKHKSFEEIGDKPLNQCIELIENENTKILARATVWLANDETHYVRKYDEEGLEKLHRFIDSLVYFILNELTILNAQETVELGERIKEVEKERKRIAKEKQLELNNK